jgi:hypothetical protein
MELYQGEVLGEALFSRMLALAAESRRRFQFGVMLQYESETKIRLRPFLARLGLPLVENEAQRAAGIELGTRYAALAWPDFVAEFHSAITRVIARYQYIERLGPEADQPMLRFMVDHERAFMSFLEKERAGEPDSLNHMQRLLRHPLPRPAPDA